MGIVWLAEQIRPVRRQVALRIIKAGMDTAQVVARFEAERQALALMDHPAIARVLDAGATPEGRPYFVMEFVRGESITAYCAKHKVSIRDRIGLFLQVCDGVQHLAADLQRHLHDEPVLAGPPTATYRVGKFVRRHRGGVAAAAALTLRFSSKQIAPFVAREPARDLDRPPQRADRRRQPQLFLATAQYWRGTVPSRTAGRTPRRGLSVSPAVNLMKTTVRR